MSRLRRFSTWWHDTFTLHRWALNPFQMYGIAFLVAVAIAQVQLGAVPTSVQADLDRQTLLSLALANIIGGGIAFSGLHLRDLETALWVEFWGYTVLVFVLGTFLWMVTHNQINPNAGYGFGLSEAFVYAAIHRSVQILLYKRARRRRAKLSREAAELQKIIDSIHPPRPVVGEGDVS